MAERIHIVVDAVFKERLKNGAWAAHVSVGEFMRIAAEEKLAQMDARREMS